VPEARYIVDFYFSQFMRQFFVLALVFSYANAYQTQPY